MKQLPVAPDTYSRADQQEMRRQIVAAISRLDGPTSEWTVVAKPTTPKRVIDATANPSDTALVLATLIEELQAKGLI